jgi:hypothetical protein
MAPTRAGRPAPAIEGLDFADTDAAIAAGVNAKPCGWPAASIEYVRTAATASSSPEMTRAAAGARSLERLVRNGLLIGRATFGGGWVVNGESAGLG